MFTASLNNTLCQYNTQYDNITQKASSFVLLKLYLLELGQFYSEM